MTKRRTTKTNSAKSTSSKAASKKTAVSKVDPSISTIKAGAKWKPMKPARFKSYSDIRLETDGQGIAKITIDRPEARNAFRPQTVKELLDAMDVVRDHSEIGVIIPRGFYINNNVRGGSHRKQSICFIRRGDYSTNILPKRDR